MRSSSACTPRVLLASVAGFAVVVAVPPSSSSDAATPDRHAPPPPVTERDPGAASAPAHRLGTVLYSHGDPTDEEQLFMELMNRARADPVAEAERVFADYGSPSVTAAVNFFLQQRPGTEYTRSENRDAFRSYTGQPPFAFNAKLIEAARKHTARMQADDEQSHQLPGEPGLLGRLSAEGYSANLAGESVFAFADSMLDAHAGFAIDYGQAVPMGQSRPSLGHRDALMNFSGTVPFTEAGVGVLDDADDRTDVGPKLITIDYGRTNASERFVTGVFYQDTDADGFYDPGEGVEGVRIDADTTTAFTITSASGGFALPVPIGAGVTTVTWAGVPGTEGADVAAGVRVLDVQSVNLKLDVVVPPAPPLPAFTTFVSLASGPLADDGSADITFDLPLLDADAPDVGEVDLTLAMDHPRPSEVRVTLLGPDGTQAVVLAGGGWSSPLAARFGRSAHALGSLSVFAGRAIQGTWRVRIEDTAPGNVGTLTSVALHVRKEWTRPVAADRSDLVLSRFSVKRGAGTADDVLTFAGTIDTGAPFTGPAPVVLAVRDVDPLGPVYFETTVADALLAGPGSFLLTPDGAARRTVRAKFTGLDVPAFPDTVTVTLSYAGTVVGQSVPVASADPARSVWKDAGGLPASVLFDVTSLSSRVVGSDRITIVKGRIEGVPPGTTAEGAFEASLGTIDENQVFGAIPGDLVVVKGTKRAGKGPGILRKAVFDPATGAFSLKFQGPHELLSPLRISLRTGTAFYEDEVVHTLE